MSIFRHHLPSIDDFITTIKGFTYADWSNSALLNRLQMLTPAVEDALPEAFALVGEVIHRLTGYHLFDCQYHAALSLYHGEIAELPTGEGKTLAAIIPAILWALQGKSVHILTFNDYLAQRDHQLAQRCFAFCQLASGCITSQTTAAERRQRYRLPIIYTTIWEIGYDELKDFLCRSPEELMAVPFDHVIVDEADAILLDKAVDPLVIARPYPAVSEGLQQLTTVVATLPADTVIINQSLEQIYLTEQGLALVESYLGQELYAVDSHWPPLLQAALKAHYLLKRDVDYLLTDNGLCLIEPSTGRLAHRQKYSHLLQTALELKEGLQATPDAVICHSITVPHLLSQYRHLCGMTGTAAASRDELADIYGLTVSVISPHLPSQRIDYPPVLCSSATDHLEAIITAIENAHRCGQPVLIGTDSVAASEQLSHQLRAHSLPHQILNARNDALEADLIAQAGQYGAITISTNMAGRGVDIRLSPAALQAGGLLIIGTCFYANDRIDQQLRGRAGRQGDPGASRFFISPTQLPTNIRRFRNPQQQLIHLRRVLTAEEKSARQLLLRYAAIQEQQRRIITAKRLHLLTAPISRPLLTDQAPTLYHSLSQRFGQEALAQSERQLLLQNMTDRWSDYLESMALVREGIHLAIIGRQQPLDAYHRIAVDAFAEMLADITADTLAALAEALDHNVLPAPSASDNTTSVLTYRIDESKNQFSCLPRLMEQLSLKAQGTIFKRKLR